MDPDQEDIKKDAELWGLGELQGQSVEERHEWHKKQYLSVEDVQEWFKQTFDGKIPSAETAQGIAKYLFHARQSLSPSGPDYEAEIEVSMLLEKLDRALFRLVKKIENRSPAALSRTHDNDSKFGRLLDLHCSVQRVQPDFSGYLDRKPGPKHSNWHDIARELGPLILVAASSAGATRAGFGKPTSPAVRVMVLALEWIGSAEATLGAVVEVMRKGRPPRGVDLPGQASRSGALAVEEHFGKKTGDGKTRF